MFVIRICNGIAIFNLIYGWWARGDLNPGPPPCEGVSHGRLKGSNSFIVNYTQGRCLEITIGLLESFMESLRRNGVGEAQIKNYSTHLNKLIGIKLCSGQDVERVFSEILPVNDKSVKAFSRLLTYIEKHFDGYEALVRRLRKAMPSKPRSGVDTYIPPDTLVLEMSRRLKDKVALKLFHNILVSTGCRGVEARYIIENISRIQAVRLGNYIRLHLDVQRGSKSVLVMYLPIEVYKELKAFRGKLPSQDHIGKTFRKIGLAVKYYRKWFRQKLKQLGIDTEIIEFMQGRISALGIGAKHYTDLITLADQAYPKILVEIRKYLA